MDLKRCQELDSVLSYIDEDFFNVKKGKIDQLIFGMSGVFDAGSVSESIQRDVLDHLESRVVAEFDSDQFFNYRSNRPSVTFYEDHLEQYNPPAIKLYYVRDSLGKTFLFLSGQEPDYQWEKLARVSVSLVKHFGIELTVWPQAISMPVPHTRPFGVTVHGNRHDLVGGISSWKPVIETAASFGHLFELSLVKNNCSMITYVIHVPQYIIESAYKPAAVAVLEYVSSVTQLALPTDYLRDEAREIEHELVEYMSNSSELRSVVEGFESRYDMRKMHGYSSSGPRSTLTNKYGKLPDGDALAVMAEKYLDHVNAARTDFSRVTSQMQHSQHESSYFAAGSIKSIKDAINKQRDDLYRSSDDD